MVSKGILYEDARQEFERRFISHALARSKGNFGRAAKMIGIFKQTNTQIAAPIPAPM